MRRLLPGLLTVACLASLVACSHTSATSGGDAWYVGPTMPPSAATDTREGALAYAEHYVATYNYARTTGDMNGLPPLEAFECRTCRALRDDLAAVYDHGGRLEGGQWAMIAPVAKEAPAIDGWVITSPLRVKPTTVYPESSNRKQVPGETTRITFEISRTTGTWEVLACDKEV